MKKTLISMLLIATMLCSMIACGGGDQTPNDTTAPQGGEETTTPQQGGEETTAPQGSEETTNPSTPDQPVVPETIVKGNDKGEIANEAYLGRDRLPPRSARPHR